MATDLSLLGFASGLPLEDIAGRCFTLIASLESFGTLLGIGVLYPIYQLYLDDGTAAGGTPYYVCGVNILLNPARPTHHADAWTGSLRSCCGSRLEPLGLPSFSAKKRQNNLKFCCCDSLY